MVAVQRAHMNSIPEVQAEHPLTERYEALIRVSQAIAAHRDPRELFCAMASELRRLIQFDGLVVAQYNAASGLMAWHVSEIGCSGQAVPKPIAPNDTITKWVYDHQEPLVIPFLERETRFPEMVSFLLQQGVRSLCVLPLTTVHRRIGSIGVGSSHPDAYCSEEVRFLSLVADQAALAIDDALHYQALKNAEAELEHKNARLQLLLQLNNTLLPNLEFRDLLRALSSSLRTVMQCDGVAVALPEPDSDQLRLHAIDFPGSKGSFREESLVKPSSSVARVFQTGEPELLFEPDGTPFDAIAVKEGLKAICHIPLISQNRTLGILSLGRIEPNPFTQQDVDFLNLLSKQVAIAIENALAFQEIARLKDQLAQEKVYLEDEIRGEMNFDEIIGRSPALRKVLQQLETVAPTDSTVLIYGDTGTGKELIARAIHNLSSRAKAPFVKLNCAAIPTGLLESELFGHEKGAFTGAVSQRIGRFELASHGTVFLDEVGEIALELQPKLLRVLQEREFERLGSSHTLRTDARLIAATNRDLAALVADQKFRADLYYRLNVFPLQVPPLRDRQEDIPLLVRYFVQQFSRRMNRVIDTIPSEAMSALVQYHWPGNIRELQNLMERAVILTTGPVLHVPLHDLESQPVASAPRKVVSLEDAERRHILEALEAANWVVAGARGAATLLGLKRSTLQARMEKLGIRRARTAG